MCSTDHGAELTEDDERCADYGLYQFGVRVAVRLESLTPYGPSGPGSRVYSDPRHHRLGVRGRFCPHQPLPFSLLGALHMFPIVYWFILLGDVESIVVHCIA